MNDSTTSRYIDCDKVVTNEHKKKAEDLWNNPDKVMQLIDLLFLSRDEDKVIPS